MATKENKGGLLNNQQVEEDLKAKGRTDQTSYQGAQDTGDSGVRQRGTDVQKADGRPADETVNQ